MKLFKFGNLLLLVLLLSLSYLAASEILNNDMIVTMVKEGLGEELIISRIKDSQNSFDLSTESILKLKQEGVNENILKVMLEASAENTIVEKTNAPSIPHENVFLLKLEVVDRTAGQSLPKEHRQNIRDEIIRQVTGKYSGIRIVTEEADKADAVLRIFIDVFTAGNRAARLWVGFGAGKAQMRMTAEWLEGTPPETKGTELYQRLGAASLRSGQAIELQMTEMIGQYSADFISKHVKP